MSGWEEYLRPSLHLPYGGWLELGRWEVRDVSDWEEVPDEKASVARTRVVGEERGNESHTGVSFAEMDCRSAGDEKAGCPSFPPTWRSQVHSAEVGTDGRSSGQWRRSDVWLGACLDTLGTAPREEASEWTWSSAE